MNKFFGHLKTVNSHRRLVRKLCFKCGLYWQGITHDLSKYSPTEFINGVKFFTGVKSPHSGERAAYGYSKAWLHHKGRNKHHPEYWQDIRSNGTTEPIPMPAEYLVEMLCDRIAASKIYLKDKYTQASPLEYYETRKYENKFHKTTQEMLEFYLDILKNDGEEVLFYMLRNYIMDSKQKLKSK